MVHFEPSSSTPMEYLRYRHILDIYFIHTSWSGITARDRIFYSFTAAGIVFLSFFLTVFKGGHIKMSNFAAAVQRRYYKNKMQRNKRGQL